MTDPATAAGPAAPPKRDMPPLDGRAPRPAVARLRRGVVIGAIAGAAALVCGALVWAFVVQPELRARAFEVRLEARTAETPGAVRPIDRVTEGPATYADLDRLPEPRALGKTEAQETPLRSAPARPSGPVSANRDLAGAARESGLFFGRAADQTPAAPGPREADVTRADASRASLADVYNTHSLLAPLSPYEVKAGALIAAALLTAVDTSRSGPVTATVTENVYDTVSGRFLLIPQGARLIGRHEGESRYGDRRAFVVWDRLILPNGKSLILPKEPGVDAAGAIGIRGQADRRLGSLVRATLFSGAITTLGQAARDRDDASGGLLGDVGDAAAIEAAQVGGRLIDRELEVQPAIRLPPGARVKVFITRDLILEPYAR
jgi:type IV secretion system protein VirB10